MTNTAKTKTNSKPLYIAYHVRDGKNEESYFTRIGVAFPNKDGKGFNLLLDVVPLDGRITVREVTEKKE